jgi:hypothetical protein
VIKFEITDGNNKPSGLNENNMDCTVRALSCAAGIDYDLAYLLMEQSGRFPGRPGHMPLGLAEYEKEGLGTFVGLRTESTLTVAQFVAAHPTGRYIVRVMSDASGLSHVLSIVDGVVYDNDRPRLRKRVRYFWHVIPKDAQS